MLNENEIISAMNSTFGNTRKPIESNLVFPKYWNGHQWVRDPYENAEVFIVKRFLANKMWQELAISLGNWEWGRSCLCCLTAEGLAYYLLAYMLFILKETKHRNYVAVAMRQ